MKMEFDFVTCDGADPPHVKITINGDAVMAIYITPKVPVDQAERAAEFLIKFFGIVERTGSVEFFFGLH